AGLFRTHLRTRVMVPLNVPLAHVRHVNHERDTSGHRLCQLISNRKGDDMKRRIWSFLKSAFPILLIMMVIASLSPRNLTYPQGRQEPGHSIGTVTTQGNLIVMTLNEGALGHANLFDLPRRTLRFAPDGNGYRAENLALQWDS